MDVDTVCLIRDSIASSGDTMDKTDGAKLFKVKSGF